MAKARAIVKRLKAVRNIRKITRTMELIATARFKRALDRAIEASAYTRKISEIVADLSQANLQFTHPLLTVHEPVVNSVLLVLTSNRGLCGGYNASILRQAQLRMGEIREAGQTLRLEVSGKRGLNFMRYQGETVDERYQQFEDRPAFDDVEQIAERYITWYSRGQIDRLDIAYMKFESASRQSPVCETLLPIGRLDDDGPTSGRRKGQDVAESNGRAVEYEFLPSGREILEEIVPAAFKARLFKCFLDAAVGEQIFRRVAMKAATENAGDMIHDLSAKYNRARQTQITSELSEIIGGVAALE